MSNPSAVDVKKNIPNVSELEAGNLLGHESYIRLNRTMAVDQMYWFPRFQPPVARDQIAIVVDDNFGNLAARLAPDYGLVLCLHASREYLERARRHVAREGVTNVAFVCVDLGASLPLPEACASALFVCRSSVMLKAQGSSANTGELLQQLLPCLKQDAILAIADNNRSSYKFLFGLRNPPRQRASLMGVSKLLARAGFTLDKYVMRADYTAHFDPSPELARLDSVADAEPMKISRVARLRQEVLGSYLMTFSWPSFMIFAQRGESMPTRFEQMVVDEGLRQRCGWKESDELVLKRLIAGNMGVTIAIAGIVGQSERDVVMRLPRSEAGYRSASTNGSVLRALADSPFSDYSPALLASGTWRGQDYFIEQRKPGREIGFRGELADKMMREACLHFTRLQAEGATRVEVDEALYNQLVGRYLDSLARYCTGQTGRLLGRIDAALRARLIGQRLMVVRKHGDFKLGNILYDEQGELSALIDWDSSVAEGLPLADFYTLATYNQKDEARVNNFLSLNRSVSVLWKVRDYYQDLLEELREILEVPASLVVPLRCAAGLISIEQRVDWTVKSHESWSTEFADLMLEDMCALLESPADAVAG